MRPDNDTPEPAAWINFNAATAALMQDGNLCARKW